MSDLSLTLRKTIPAPVETVFNAWLDAKMLSKFMMPGKDMTVPRAESDGREGGRFMVVMAAGENEIPHAGTYLEVTPHERIVFTWESPHSVDGSTVTLNFKPAGPSATDLTLTHVKFASEEARTNHQGGWAGILEKLAEVAG
ncbi:SRPBCC family protein [Oricola cellulosilytica]|uniref:SRPBCC domain-containing protein n=1 Tax=Oricola cellulosilytica TaxID=1429082 RepID=A0A4R0PJE1_9HYPH|nr:SRPBCC domain-containing protein [Oricola cellulosilytica]TCD16520.1 SRPBCC domain-containing protein [Oricola cellulosilytica]